ncbi:DUF4116 domain-containing protein [Oxalobacter vibrioformis]|uniref:DUF4116 domain-containing protein n=1 Tax=Oxalobacter vibrioformis TaxID=933080 RepID=A0A9E9LYI3_9BURK|nr:DUF4116 domain-containing protein [Oxalobacter vibrioformis]WAW10766.1 DUF4116 domain-containing protein [Oxalobacter vibrioformis]
MTQSFKTLEDCFAAVEQDSWALQRVPRKFRTLELCLAAVQKNGWVLGCAVR